MRFATNVVPGSNEYIEGLANAAYENIVERGFDRGDEEDADQEGIRLANKVGYNPSGLGTFLTKLADRNKAQSEKERNGLFASHPETQRPHRQADAADQVRETECYRHAWQARYAAAITFDAKPVSEIATVLPGTRGVAGASAAKEPEETEAPPRSRNVDSACRRRWVSRRASRRSRRRPPRRPETAPSAPTAPPRGETIPRNSEFRRSRRLSSKPSEGHSRLAPGDLAASYLPSGGGRHRARGDARHIRLHHQPAGEAEAAPLLLLPPGYVLFHVPLALRPELLAQQAGEILSVERLVLAAALINLWSSSPC